MSMKKSIILIIIATIIAGLIVIFTAGFNKDVLTKSHGQITVSINKEFENKDIKDILKDVLGDKVEVQKTGDFEDQVVISSEGITEENKGEIINKINEKYETQIEANSITIEEIPDSKISDILKHNIWSFAIATVLVLVYLAVRYKKQGGLSVILKTIASLAVTELLVLCLVALIRIPVGQNLNSIVYVTYGVSLLAITTLLENKKQKMMMEEKNNKKS